MDATLTSESTLVVPSQATAGTFSTDGHHLAVGSDDGSVRLYEPPEHKVRKALRGLGASVSSVLFHALDAGDSVKDSDAVWVAAGNSIYRFDLTAPKLIYARADAVLAKDIGQDDEDVVNQLALSANRAHLACTTDAGGVYVMDVDSGEVSKMKTGHASIAWTASFIPDRPNELLTGGYDCALLLHDFKLRTLLARLDITPAPALAPGISSLPPFITALALSAHGAVAAGTADGRIWVGLGGMKSKSKSKMTSAKKEKNRTRTRKWYGLNEEEGFFTKVGESLIAGLQFITPDTLLSCTLYGKLALHHLTSTLSSTSTSSTSASANASTGLDVPPGGLRTIWTAESACAKVDVLAFSAQQGVAVVGLHKDGKRGAVEMWMLSTSDGMRGDEASGEGGGEDADVETKEKGETE